MNVTINKNKSISCSGKCCKNCTVCHLQRILRTHFKYTKGVYLAINA